MGLAAVLWLATRAAERSGRISADLLRLQDTTAQIRVRGAMVLLIGFAAVAQTVGLEVILGTFIAGALLKLADRDEALTHPSFYPKLEAIGFGFFIPVFFVSSGVRFDLQALTDETSTLVMVPIFLAALLVVRGLPALLYRGYLPDRQVPIAGLLQATSLPFIVAATAIGARPGPDRPGRERRSDRRGTALGDGVPRGRGQHAGRWRRRWGCRWAGGPGPLDSFAR